MPRKPKVPCKHPLCSRLIEPNQKYCEEHKPMHRHDRPSSYERGYNSRWKKERNIFLNQNPFCAECLRNGRYVTANVVDHIKPHRGNQELFWDKNNWQALCKKCHDTKTGKYERYPVYKYRNRK